MKTGSGLSGCYQGCKPGDRADCQSKIYGLIGFELDILVKAAI